MPKPVRSTALPFSIPWALLAITACSSDDDGVPPNDFARISCDDVAAPCAQFVPAEIGDLLDAVQALENGTTVVLGRGTFAFDNSLTIRGASNLTFTGQGMDDTVLSFLDQATQTNGVDVIGDDFTITDLSIEDAKKDGLRVADSSRVTIRRVRVTWTGGPSADNGAYGIYPVACRDVLVEDSEAFNASDAGLYVGQVERAIVRGNTARGNVAGIEIENTQFADVYDNLAEDNTAGLVVFDLPGNPVFGRDVKIHDNLIRNNNRANFAPAGGNSLTTVSQIPAGTGTFVLASRRVEIFTNTYENNQTVDIAVLSGLAIQPDPGPWGIKFDELVGNPAGLELSVTSTTLQNFRTSEVWIHSNLFSGSGTMPDGDDPEARPLGALLALTYGSNPVDNIVYDGIGETVSSTSAAANSNENRLCLENNEGATYATLDLPVLQAKAQAFVDSQGQEPPPGLEDLHRPEAPFDPFDCPGFSGGPIPDIRLAFNTEETAPDFPHINCSNVAGSCQQFTADQETSFLDAVNSLSDDVTLVLGAGTFAFNNGVSFRRATGTTLVGQGIDVTTLDFSTQTAQENGVDAVGDGFTIQDLTVVDAKKDAVRIEDSDDVTVRRVKVTWSAGPSVENGAYGIYPVQCTNVLVEDSEAYNASDAGLYVGQVIGAIVRRNIAKGNVAGIEIENTQFADVYANLADDNTAGIAIFDLPGNPVVGRDVRVRQNAVLRNNRENFAPPGTTVSQIPAGTGTFTLASRRVEIHDNLFLANDTAGVAVLSGLVVENSTAAWTLELSEVVGSLDDLNLPTTATTVANYVLNEIWVHDNAFARIGEAPDEGRGLGTLLHTLYALPGNGPVDAILYDGIGERFDPEIPAVDGNTNHVCIGPNAGGRFALLDLPRVENLRPFPTIDDIFRPEAPFAPFDCRGFTAGPIPNISLPFMP